MQSIRIIAMLSIAALFAIPFSGCGLVKTTGDIDVTVTILPGETLDLTGISIQLHGTSTFDNLLFKETGTGSATSVTASFKDLEERKYYLCAWADNDNDLQFSTGDLVGWYPYPIELIAKDKLELPIEVYVED